MSETPPTIVIKVRSLMTSKEEAGRAIDEAIRTYEERTGKRLFSVPWWRRLFAVTEWQSGYLIGTAVVCLADVLVPNGLWWTPMLGAVLALATVNALARRRSG